MTSKIGIFGRKVCMTRQFDEQKGILVPSSLVEFGLNQVVQLKTNDAWGYTAIKVAYDEKKNSKHLTKRQIKRQTLIATSTRPSGESELQPRWLRSSGEFRVLESDQNRLRERFNVGQTLDVRLFSVGQSVSVTGTPVGKGFIGNQKKHNFSRGPMTHGSKNHRRPGSLGAGSTPSRVYPGKKMAGRSRGTVNVRSQVLLVDENNNILILRGSLPGSRRTALKVTIDF